MAAKNHETGQTATRALQKLILDRQLQPGDPFPTEGELVEELGISRSSVREAVRTLVALDILDVRHGTGTFVGQLSLTPMVQSLVFRGMLQPREDLGALRDVIELRTALDLAFEERIVLGADHDTSELRDAVAEMKACNERGEALTAADRRFHLVMAQRVENMLYPQLVQAFWDIHRLVAPRLGVASPRDRTETISAHEQLLAAVEARDVVAYRHAVRDHYRPLLRALKNAPSAKQAG